MLNATDFYEHVGDTFEIEGEVFTFDTDSDFTGVENTWNSDKHVIDATINYEFEGIPISIREIRPEGCEIMGLDTRYEGPINSFEEYKEIVHKEATKLLKGLTPEDFKEYEGEVLEINGIEYKFEILHDLGGAWCMWDSGDNYILATINYERRGIPISVYDKSGEFIDLETSFEGAVNSWGEYKKIVLDECTKLLGGE